MTTDLILAVLHHWLVFSIAALLAAEFALVRPGISRRYLKLLGRIDSFYGVLAGAIVIVGAARVYFGLKGWEYYIYNHVFWAKMGAFVIVGLLSVPPTLRFIRWNRAAAAEADYAVPDAEISAMRRYLWLETLVLALVIIFAAMMARGYGV